MLNTSVRNSAQVRRALQKAAAKYTTNKKVLVGIRGDAGQHEDSDIKMAQLGAIHEFGTPTIDARPFLRTGVEEAQPMLRAIAESRLAEDGAEKVLGLIGLAAKGAVQNKMVNLRTPSNAASTIRAKGSSNPLIDTGGLLNSITFVVTDENVEEGL